MSVRPIRSSHSNTTQIKIHARLPFFRPFNARTKNSRMKPVVRLRKLGKKQQRQQLLLPQANHQALHRRRNQRLQEVIIPAKHPENLLLKRVAVKNVEDIQILMELQAGSPRPLPTLITIRGTITKVVKLIRQVLGVRQRKKNMLVNAWKHGNVRWMQLRLGQRNDEPKLAMVIGLTVMVQIFMPRKQRANSHMLHIRESTVENMEKRKIERTIEVMSGDRRQVVSQSLFLSLPASPPRPSTPQLCSFIGILLPCPIKSTRESYGQS
mmetsp:Transcript_21529/g.31278  ORF Transcript_21529/g.31278 Transcript_21529/m.31278 type:complete len:267 (+) Transcript_21529:442-1242(+)